jgi:hypothetical protein
MKKQLLPLAVVICSACISSVTETDQSATQETVYDQDLAFLKKYGEVIELTDSLQTSKVAVMGALQARVMTSTSRSGLSYGWINRTQFESADTSEHINAFGGEERFWLGPEGGQFSIFFEKGKSFDFENWHTPRIIDLEAYDLVESTPRQAHFKKSAQFKNYAGTLFDITIDRTIRVLEPKEVYEELNIPADTAAQIVAYETNNVVTNNSPIPWSKKTGLLSIWLLGMYNPSPSLTVIIPYVQGDEKLGAVVNDDYFGKVPSDRLKVTSQVIYFKGDGQLRSKLGVSPLRAKDVLGSYDDSTRTLTIVKYSKKEGAVDYVNSKWEIQKNPYGGDAVNSYNDGPVTPGAKSLGGFYELETSSHSEELQEDETLTHRQLTIHFTGDQQTLDNIMQQVFGVTLMHVRTAFN